MSIKKKVYLTGIITFLVFLILAWMSIWTYLQVLEASRIRNRLNDELAGAKHYADWKNGLIRSISDIVASGHAPPGAIDLLKPPFDSPTGAGKELADAGEQLVSMVLGKEQADKKLKADLDEKRRMINRLYFMLDQEIATALAKLQMDRVLGLNAPEKSSLAPYVLKSLNQLTLIALNALISQDYPEENRRLVNRNRRFLDDQLELIDEAGTIAALFDQLFGQLASLETFIPRANLIREQYESRINAARATFDRVASGAEIENKAAKAEAEFNRANEILERDSRRNLISVILMMAAAPVLVVVLGVIGLKRSIIDPIGQLVAAMRHVEAGCFDVAAPVRRDNEIGRLARAFNAMAAEIKAKVTALSRINQTLEESETKYRTLVDNIPQRIFSKTMDLTYVSCNSHFARDLGLTETEIVGKNDYDLFPEALAEKYRSDDARIIETEATEEIEERFIHNGGESVIMTVKTPLRDERGRVIGVLGIFWDITERKQAEKELQLARFSLDNSSIGVFRIDSEGLIQYINKRVLQRLGYRRRELIGRPIWKLDPNASPKRFARHWSKLSDGQPVVFESTHLTKSGQEFPIEISARQAEFRGVRLIFGYVSDIGNRKKMEAQLRQAQKMESIGRLAGGIAHDFNNMLTIILGSTELALAGLPVDDPLTSRLIEIRKAAASSADLTRQLLAFARRQTISPKALNLNNAVEATLKMVRRLIGEDIELVWRPVNPPWAVKIDPSQLEQILTNLCVNARDAVNGVGKLIIETDNVTLDDEYYRENIVFQSGEYVMLAVSDNGRGMDRETQAMLFEPFFTTKAPGLGSGLGLAMVYGIVRQNNGAINVYSEPEQGTTFKIYFPRCLEEPRSESAGKSIIPTAGNNETVLLVEDEPAILDVTKQILGQLGYNVLAATGPGQALEIGRAEADRIDLLMTDVVMPEMNGRRLAEILLAENPKLKRLFMSGYTANVIARRGVLDKGVRFIQKPFTGRELAVKVREALDEEEG